MIANPFFSSMTYVQRRQELMKQLPGNTILLLGNNESSSNFKDNWYHFRQDSTFLYYAGISLAGLALLINTDTGEEILFGEELNIDEIIWTGPQPLLPELAAKAGINKTKSFTQLKKYLKGNIAYLPTYRPEHSVKLSSWLGRSINELEANVCVPLIKAIAKQRSCKSAEELAQLDKASTVTSCMHRAVITGAKEGMYEHEVAAIGQKVLWTHYANNSFLPIVTVNGNVLHNHYYGNRFENGKMLLFDSGAELQNGYCGDMTRTIPSGKKFSSKQREIYTVVHSAYNKAVSLLKPGVKFKDVHIAACVAIADGLTQIGLMKGNPEEAVSNGAHTMFFQCGLGHMIGLDVHDMENLGEEYIGYSDEMVKSKDFGLKSLRLGKALEENFALTVEPGIYIIAELIDMWRAKGIHSDFINYELLETYKDFGGIRVEDCYAITSNGYKLLGEPLAIHCTDIEKLREDAYC
jgi:Xaa-Pro aminopeptidase